MNKKGIASFGTIVGLFAMIIVSLALVPTIFNEQAELTTKNPVVNESIDLSAARIAGGNDINESLSNFTISNSPGGNWQETFCPVEDTSYQNETTVFVADTDYIFYPSLGIVNVLNTTSTRNSPNETFVGYTYCPEGYNKDASSRSIAGLIGLFSVLALLAFVLWKADIMRFGQ